MLTTPWRTYILNLISTPRNISSPLLPEVHLPISFTKILFVLYYQMDSRAMCVRHIELLPVYILLLTLIINYMKHVTIFRNCGAYIIACLALLSSMTTSFGQMSSVTVMSLSYQGGNSNMLDNGFIQVTRP